MDEAAFWTSLEYRVCRELAGMPRKGRGALWCDGFCPEVYQLSGATPRIDGHAWIGYTRNVDEWKFTLFLPATFNSRDSIDWSSLLPPENVTCWLAIDEQRHVLQIEPGAAVPDLE